MNAGINLAYTEYVHGTRCMDQGCTICRKTGQMRVSLQLRLRIWARVRLIMRVGFGLGFGLAEFRPA